MLSNRGTTLTIKLKVLDELLDDLRYEIYNQKQGGGLDRIQYSRTPGITISNHRLFNASKGLDKQIRELEGMLGKAEDATNELNKAILKLLIGHLPQTRSRVWTEAAVAKRMTKPKA